MSAASWSNRALRWGILVLAAVALWASLPAARFALEAIAYPFQLDPIESKVLQHALWFGAGHPVYFALGPEPPWVVGNYPPLFPWLCSLGVDSALPDFAWPRTLALLSTLAAGLLLAATVWRATRSVGLALLGAGLWWSTHEVYRWVPLCRVDLPALALGAAGLALGIALWGRWSWPRLLGVCALFWLAWLTRQSQVLLPLALVVGMFAGGQRAWAWRLALTWMAGVALLMAGLCLATRGEFWVLTVRDNVNAWSAAQMKIWILHMGRTMWPLGLAALAIGAVTVAWTRGARDEKAPAALGSTLGVLGLCFAFNLLNVAATGKAGADKNYLLEPLWCLCALLPLLWRWLAQRGIPRAVLAVFSALMVGQMIWMLWNPWIPTTPWREGLWLNRTPWRPRISERDRRRDAAVMRAVWQADGPVLCEYGIYPLRAGRALIHEPFLMSQLAREGRWDEAPLLDRIRRGEFALIVVEDDLDHPTVVTPAFAATVREHCTLDATLPGVITHHLWRPQEFDQIE